MLGSGFTLLELLLSLAIFSVAALAIYACLSGGLAAWRKAQKFGGQVQSARLVLDDMAKELRNAVLLWDSALDGQSQKVHFLTVRRTLSPKGRATWEALRTITYEVRREPSGSRYALWRQESSAGVEGKSIEQNPEKILDQISRFEFEYAGKDSSGRSQPWSNSWDKDDRLPMAVRMTLEVEGSKFTKMVFLPQARAPKEE